MLAMKHFYIIPEYMNHHIGLIYKKEKCKVMALKIRSSCICCLKNYRLRLLTLLLEIPKSCTSCMYGKKLYQYSTLFCKMLFSHSGH